MSAPLRIRYRVDLPDGSQKTLTLLPAALDRSLDELRPLFDAWQIQ